MHTRRMLSVLVVITLTTGCQQSNGGTGPISDPIRASWKQVLAGVADEADFSLFAKAVLRVDIPILESVKAQDYVQIFAPTNKAIRAYLADQKLSEEQFLSQPGLAEFLKGYMINSNKSIDFTKSYTTLAKTTISFAVRNPDCLSTPNIACEIVLNGTAKMVSALGGGWGSSIPSPAPNGLLSLIDKVLENPQPGN